MLESEPGAARYLRSFVGAHEYLRGGARWILALLEASPAELARLPRFRERNAVRVWRQASKSEPIRRLAASPTFSHVNVLPAAPS